MKIALGKPRFRLLTIPAQGDPDWLDLSPVSAETMGRSAALGEAGPTVLIRHQKPYVLLGPKDHRLPELSGGIRYLQGLGLPVYDRIGGGSAVLLDQDCISFAVARPCRDLGMITRNSGWSQPSALPWALTARVRTTCW